MMRRGRFPGSPGQIALIVVIVIAVLIMYGGSGNPGVLMRAAWNLAFLFPALIMSLSFHELAHALVANWLGDDTAKRQGRLTLDPRAHLDPLGTLMLVMTVILGFGIGWAKPVPVNPWRLRIGPRAGMAVVGIAGPLSNLLIAFVVLQIVRALSGGAVSRDILEILFVLARLNVFLAVFNMIPIPPLDGYRVLVGILPGPIANSFASLEPYGPMILMMFVFMGQRLLMFVVQGVSLPILGLMMGA